MHGSNDVTVLLHIPPRPGNLMCCQFNVNNCVLMVMRCESRWTQPTENDKSNASILGNCVPHNPSIHHIDVSWLFPTLCAAEGPNLSCRGGIHTFIYPFARCPEVALPPVELGTSPGNKCGTVPRRTSATTVEMMTHFFLSATANIFDIAAGV